MWQLIVPVVVFICSVHRAAGYASYMTSSACTRSITAGTSIMGKSAISETSRQITVKRGSTFLSSGDSYTPGEQLEVSISDTSGQYVFELNQGSFQGGSCTGSRRYANGIGSLNTPITGSGSLVILGAWAPSKTNVRIVPPFTLIEAVASPTSHPTLLPTIEPTLEPTVEPSFQPTPKPGETSLPTQHPTTATLMMVTYTAEQALTNITAKEVKGDQEAEQALAATMQLTLTETMAPLATPLFVNISAVKTLNELTPVASSLAYTEERDAKQSFLRHNLYELSPLESTEPSTRVSYLIAFYLEETAYETPEELHESLDIALNVIMDSQLFITTLRSFNVSALSNAHTASLLSTALESVDVLRSAAPTIAPTRLPTFAPSRLPSPAPTVNTASLDTSSLTDDAYHAPQRRKIIVGVVVGVVSTAALALSLYFYATATSETVVQVQWVLSGLPVVFASACASAAIGLVAAWATDSPSDDPFYLNKPDWQSNIFAYHPVFMTLFCALQVQALCTWSVFSVHLTAKIAHILVQLCAVAAVIMGLISIVQHMWDTRSPSLVSMHSWVGVAAVAVFGFNFLWGSTMGYLSAFHKHSPLHVRLSLLLSHKYLGVTALVLAAVALNTGVMDKLFSGACDYHVDLNADPQQDFDPAGTNLSYLTVICLVIINNTFCM